jgi:hypothetical protein
MAHDALTGFDLDTPFVHLEDGAGAKRLEVTPGFWKTTDARPSARVAGSSPRRAPRRRRARDARLGRARPRARCAERRAHEPSEMWFVTYREGTRHRGL